MDNDLIPADVLAEVLERVARPGWQRFAEMLAHTGGCARPVRLKGTTRRVEPDTGELSITYDSGTEPDGVLLKACQSRRATRCPACAATYRSDARALVLAGLVGGKGIPEDVASHPLVFVTLTAPSFGAVHREADPCRPKPYDCPCGRGHICEQAHEAGDPQLGRPLCADGYDYPGVILWNNRVTELWRRTTIATRRQLAGLLGDPVRDFHRQHRLAYVKVVEYQARGLIHVHALIRLDPVGRGSAGTDSAALAAAVLAATARAWAPNPLPQGRPIRWGVRNQVDVVALERRQRLAGYLAKYTVKSVDSGGALDHRLDRVQLNHLAINDHLHRLVQTCWDLGADPALADCRLREWAHTLGFRGHWLTKSPNWSTSLTALRRARHEYQLERAGRREDGITFGEWIYAGTGHQTEGDAWLAQSEAKSRYLNRRIAWEER